MKIIIHPEYTHLKDFINNLPTLFQQEGTMLHDGRNTVKSFQVNGIPVIVKRYKRPHLIQRITYTFFKKSKAERAYLFAEEFRKRGFQTPHEIAFIEIKRTGLFHDSYFASLACYDQPLLPLLNREGFDKHLADELAAYLVAMHEKGALHGDLNLTNILYRNEGEQYYFSLIDTNRSHFPDVPPTQTECMENLKRLSHNKELLKHVVTQYARLRNWSPKECLTEIFDKLARFEQKKARKRKLQSWIGIKK